MRQSFSAAIFDMDGLLIDSEPLWYEAAVEVFQPLGIELTPELYASSIGLRTVEFVDHWFTSASLSKDEAPATVAAINETVLEKIRHKGEAMPGVYHVLEQCRQSGISIGLATSSPVALIDVVVDKLKIREYFDAFSSAEHLLHGKPHPQVYLDCASALHVPPMECVCFEDSFHGLIAAKAARMTCVAVPLPDFRNQQRFQAADFISDSLLTIDLQQLTELRGKINGLSTNHKSGC